MDIAKSGVNSLGQTIPLGPVALANCYDISHVHSAFVASLRQGADKDPVVPKKRCMVPANPQFKYVDNSTGVVQPYVDLARAYGFANRMFQTNQGPSFPAHPFIFGGTLAPYTDTRWFAAENMKCTLEGAGCTALASQTVALVDGTGVSWVIPTGANSDHAADNDGTGPQWVAAIVNSIGAQSGCPDGESYRHDTAILITWDDWGGCYDHVRPFQVSVAPPAAWGDGYTYGFRVPLLVGSAYTKAGHVGNDTLDFGKLLFFIEQNFGLGFIAPGADMCVRYADYRAAAPGDSSDFLRRPKSAIGSDDD